MRLLSACVRLCWPAVRLSLPHTSVAGTSGHGLSATRLPGRVLCPPSWPNYWKRKGLLSCPALYDSCVLAQLRCPLQIYWLLKHALVFLSSKPTVYQKLQARLVLIHCRQASTNQDRLVALLVWICVSATPELMRAEHCCAMSQREKQAKSVLPGQA